MKKVKIAIIGTGRIGKMHIENIANLREYFELVAIADSHNSELEKLAEKYQIPVFTKNYQDILNNKDIEAVLIASSTDTHAKIIIDAAKSGKDILCEKPIDTKIERIKEVLAAVKENDVILQIGFNRRFDHNFHKIHEYVAAGSLGDPQIIKISSRDPEPPSLDYVKVSGGLFSDMMIHDFDMARYLSHSEVTEVFANGAVLVDPNIGNVGDIDTAIVTLKFANGALGVIDNSRQAVYGYDQRAGVFGSKGQAFSQNDHLSSVELDDAAGGHLDKIPTFFIERYTQAYVDELKSFHTAITEHTEPAVTGFDGLQAVKIAQACLKSLKTHQPVVIK
ncbi:inositol 2-dehydrogenase [Liquorilactobacillus oeni]|uniref:Oxidoreductase, NAD-binding protein n=1 Tax=Liquorilactobacillus oeni DSM 19972 TaxID=1423777 RepID=A0A0R1M8X3_9LACO|nr:inositol 2-dehydrogenase [Liquorilactobacillus oeni]KRL04556.1 oxidoreductase, NAD-binding protein [Liquorilactobacillus oeni DSM 19972]